ncbi:farnesyl-diphosphate synthase [Roseivivax halodurans JCM 10272]|uniref:Geranylgeranyl diphosphate synthase n=1 Tax=Roseivivax halodurans JCM 10272 TaxID=1449350 RepID=X7EFX6_9RHOB|nr:polyprenyl synthetase family protein [Roseivivax halodurans]ETX14969.1 farnesyl-diphosphate synthase [Roseivivax halodurans JCM 10272]
MAFEDDLAAAQERIEAGFDRLFAAHPHTDLHAAMRYAVSGGKRLRGYLVLEGARLHGVPDALNAALAIEAVHAYSLVHDDLPAMDDDDTRRGQPTVHRKWDDATAILAGDALQSLAFELCLAPGCHPDAEVRGDLAFTLAQASGAQGMVLGQALDIAAETSNKPLDLEAITRLQAAKTGALITWAGEAGARLARADPVPLRTYANALGLAFQIADDLLDVEGDAAEMGKAARKDEAANKATFVSLLGVDGAKRRASDLVDTACAALSGFGEDAEGLKQAARFAIARRT